MPITYHNEEIEFQLPNAAQLTSWLEYIASSKDRKISQITFIFCNDDYLLNINREHLNHDYYTDIITFPYKQGKEIESDIFISIDRVGENATSFASTFENELLRVMSHGLLHLIGYKDKTEEDKAEMRQKEDWAIAKFHEMIV